MINLLSPSMYIQAEAQGSSSALEGRSSTELPQAQAENSSANTIVNYEASKSAPSENQGGEMADHTREEIDAKIATSEARTDTKIALLGGKLDLVLSKLDIARDDNRAILDRVRDDNRATRANQLIIGFGLAGLMIAIVALLPVFFGIGVQIKDMVDHAVETHATKK